MVRVFISSVQKEFSEERKALAKYIREDALLRRFFEPFIFEELPAINLSAPEAYLAEAAQSEIYLGIFGKEYGYEDADGVSPTEREFDKATEQGNHRIIFIKRCSERNPKETKFIKRVEEQLVRKGFNDFEELRTSVYSSLIRFLEDNEYLRFLPWDASLHRTATLDDIDREKVKSFVALAKEKRGFPLDYSDDNLLKILVHLDLATAEGRLTNAALLLFAKNPQHFFLTTEVKCVVFPTTVKTKPLLSYQTFRGSIFELVDEAVGFVMQHIDAAVSVHNKAAVDVEYEIPIKAVREVIVNAIVHCQNESNASVEVMLFKDRLEVWNPGTLPQGLTLDSLKGVHNSIPANPIIALPAYLAGYIERLGTGTTDVVETCVAAGLPTPEYKQEQNHFISVIWRKMPDANGPQSGPQYLIDNKDIDNTDSQSGPQYGPQSGPQGKLAQRYRGLLETIVAKPTISKEDLAAQFKISLTTLKRDLRSLRQSYEITWIGWTQNGHWEVKELEKKKQ
ncbi:MAG: DUF4062 domain-containing protein [Bacteroidales bacterium]|nr:DUF4062 domain-containing protein [Bacteroidales bacterium]